MFTQLPDDTTPVPVAAEIYAELGFAVVPLHGIADGKCTCGNADCAPNVWGKHPIARQWQKQASADRDTVRELFKSHRGNVGIYLARRYVAIELSDDVDLPETLTARSGSGNTHLIYALAPHQDATQISMRPVDGLRAYSGGQLVVAPSIHSSGARYTWTRPIVPAQLPDAIFERIRKSNVVELPGKARRSEPGPEDWKRRLKWEETRSGGYRVRKHVTNAIATLRYCPEWAGRVRFDVHSQTVTVNVPPWHEPDAPADNSGERPWTDQDSVRLSSWLQRALDLDLGVSDCDRAVQVAAEASPYHPVRDYFDSLTWDGVARIAKAPITYLGAAPSKYVELVFRWWMTAAVARTYQPGCKADNVLILEGVQGLKKSSALRALVGSQWFSDTPIDLQSKDAFVALNGKLVVELAELESLRRTDAARQKSFFSSPSDTYRQPYGKRAVTIPRGCVFAGTVNPAVYLQDPTGNRRFWPIACTSIDVEAIARDRDQLWAEAVWFYREGAKWWPSTPEEQALCEAAQEPRGETDEWEAIIAPWANRQQAPIRVQDILVTVLDIPRGQWSRGEQMRIATILQRLGYVRRQVREAGGREWRYVRQEPVSPTPLGPSGDQT